MGDYFIKDDYQHGTANTTLVDSAEDYFAPTRELLSRHVQYHVYKLAADLIRRHRLKSCIDVGCGLADKLVEVIAPLAEVAGVDQQSVVDAVRKKYPMLNIVAADLEKPEDAGLGRADLVISSDVIEHMFNPDVLLRFIGARCHRDSYVVISTPERDVRRGPGCIASPKPEHVREWNRAELGRYLEASGFKVLEQHLVPGFRIGGSWYMLKERVRLLRKGISVNYCQVAVCRPA